MSVLGAAVALAAALPWGGQAGAEQSVNANCDVAIWTAPIISANRDGLTEGGLLSLVLQKPEQKNLNTKEALSSFFTSDFIMDVVRMSDLPKVIGRPLNYAHVPASFENRILAQKSNARSYSSDNRCYVEIYIDQIRYNADPISGEELWSYIWIKDFRAGKMRRYASFNSMRMYKFTGSSVEDGVWKLKWALLTNLNKSIAKKLSAK
jgi:hypothetical protein